jgi:chromate reductase
MTSHRKVAVIVGSLRKDSVTRKVAKAVESLAPDTLEFEEIPIGDLAHFNQDEEAAPPPPYVAFRQKIKATDAILFLTPEYNRGLPGVMKNAIDVGSRPYGSSVWDGKPAAVISVSPGGVGGFGANHQLRQSLAFLNVPALPHEAYVGGAFGLFDDKGQLTNESTAGFLRDFGVRFADWIERHAR